MSAELPVQPATPAVVSSSRFAVASWIALVGGLILTVIAYNTAVYFRRPGEWLPGIGEALLGLVITAVVTFGCGLTALLRRERRWRLALLPLAAGSAALGYFAWCWIRK